LATSEQQINCSKKQATMTENANPNVTYKTEGRIGTIEFYHPKGNSLPGSILTKLTETIREAGTNGDIHAIVMKSGGRSFLCRCFF